MGTAAIFLASLGIIATALVGWLVHKKTKKVLERLKAIMIARVTPAEYQAIEALIEDIERTGKKRGTIFQDSDGVWSIKWFQATGGGTIKPAGELKTRKIK